MIDVSRLTDKHRVVMRFPSAPREFECGLWVDPFGELETDSLSVIRWRDGSEGPSAQYVVRVIDPPFEPTPGMVVGDPGNDIARAVYLPTRDGDRWPWLGMVPDEEGLGYSPEHWFPTDTICRLIEDRGWEVMS